LEPPLCVVSNWIKKVYTILVWNTISGSSNLDICCYHCLILTLIFHLKVLINFFIIIIIIIIIIIVVVIMLLLTIIYTINLSVVRPRSCRVIYYFDTPALGRRHQSFGRVSYRVQEGCVCIILKSLKHLEWKHYHHIREPYQIYIFHSYFFSLDHFCSISHEIVFEIMNK